MLTPIAVLAALTLRLPRREPDRGVEATAVAHMAAVRRMAPLSHAVADAWRPAAA